jgi:hypothetical protein
MNGSPRTFTVLSATLLASMVSAVAAATQPLDACPDFPIPAKAKLQVVAQQMSVGNVPMKIMHLEIAMPPAVILAYYRAKWAATAAIPAAVEYPLGPWQVIATRRGNCFYTAQLKPLGSNDTEGLLGVTAPPSKSVAAKEAVPMLPGSNVVNDMGHNDSGKTARTVLLSNQFSTLTNADFYQRNLTDQGWQVINRYHMDEPGRNGDVIVLRKGLRELSITATRDARNADTSNVLLNYVDQP